MMNLWSKFVDISHNLLWSDSELLQYLSDRNINRESIVKFKIGKFPPVEQLISLFDTEWLRTVGLLKDNRTPFYKFPLVIPVQDVHGHYIGIGARTLIPDYKPKYINSVFKKANHLYGLNTALPTVMEDGAVVVEGYFDVIASHQQGFNNVVAYCGTGFNKKHICLLARYTDKIDIIADADNAGSNTLIKWSNKISPSTKMRCFQLLKAKDLDEYFNKYSGHLQDLYGKNLVEFSIQPVL